MREFTVSRSRVQELLLIAEDCPDIDEEKFHEIIHIEQIVNGDYSQRQN